MTKEEFKIMWKKWLVEIGKSETELCKDQERDYQIYRIRRYC